MISLSSISLYNSIAVITLEDNLAHTYMIDLLIDKDNSLPVGYCAFVVPYNEEILKICKDLKIDLIVLVRILKTYWS